MSTLRLGRRSLVLGGGAVLGMTAVARRIAASSGTLLARFETSYLESAESRPRAFNVELAVSAIDGVAILPGKTFSFNHVVGERTAAFGFEKATVIRDRMVAEGTGGGTCQVASTMHAAALLAGLDIAERVPHSRPSKYIRMGLDATVAYPRLDLKIHNPRPDRVVVRARAARGSLVVMLEADAPERPSVHLVSEILERTPFPQTVERDSLAAPDVVRVKEHGIPGYRVLRTRDIRRADGVVWRDQRLDVYPPTAQRLVAAPRVDVTALAPPEDDVIAPEEPAPASPRLLDDPALRPTHIQLHPARQVALDNVAS